MLKEYVAASPASPRAAAPSAVVFDEARARRLAEIYAPCFTLVLQLRAAADFGDAAVLRRRILDLLDLSEREAMRAGIPSEDLRLAKFALVAFLDETILSSDWHQKDRWIAQPLQLELYDRYDAGEEFFVQLERLRAQPAAHAEVLEVFYLCMALGFKGRYQIVQQEQIRVLIEGTYADLSRLPGMVAGALAPHGKPRDQVATEVRSKLPTWVIVAAAAVVALVLYATLSWINHRQAQQVADEIRRLERVETTR
jgi:type VI secretion system protein ImpK